MTASIPRFAHLLAVAILAPLSVANAQSIAAAEGQPTHEMIATIELKHGDQPALLNTFCVSPSGDILAACGGAKSIFKVTASGRKAQRLEQPGQVRVFGASGGNLANWDVPFVPQAINVGPDGRIYVAGEGRLVVLDSDGDVVAEAKLPHLADEEALKKASLEEARSMVERVKVSNERTLARYEKDLAAIEAIPENERSEADTVKLNRTKTRLASLKRSLDNPSRFNIEQQAASYFQRKLKVTSVAVSERDVFIAAAARKGSGYELWRMSHDLDDAECIKQGLRGCCGQLDVQVHGDGIVIAENTKHRVARYDRDGELLGTFGKRARGGDEGFGGCCNPMNTRIDKHGRIFTAESEGILKCYSADGELLANLGTADLAGGCKHVAIGIEPNGDRVFMLDFNNAAIAVMAPKVGSKPIKEKTL